MNLLHVGVCLYSLYQFPSLELFEFTVSKLEFLGGLRYTPLQIYHCRNVKSLYIATLGPWLDSRLYLSQANTIPRSIQDHTISSNEDQVMEEWLNWLLLPVEGIDLSSCGSMSSYQRPLEE